MKRAKLRPLSREIPLKFNFWWEKKLYRIALCLNKGRSDHVRFHEFHYHDEGHSSSQVVFWRKENIVIMEENTDGTDCDGRMSTHSVSTCHRNNLHGWRMHRRLDEDRLRVFRLRYPIWDYEERRQRDYSAEAMGY